MGSKKFNQTTSMHEMGGHVYMGGKFQISNGVGDEKNDRASEGLDDEDSLLKRFIRSNKELVDKDILVRLNRGDRMAINEALNQIHWRSLRSRENMDVAKK